MRKSNAAEIKKVIAIECNKACFDSFQLVYVMSKYFDIIGDAWLDKSLIFELMSNVS